MSAKKVSKSLAQKALTKGTVYPIVKKIAKAVGIRMTKQIFANGVSKIVPIIGGIATGGLTYATFKPGAKKLQKSFQSLNLCNPEYYKNPENFPEEDIEYSEFGDADMNSSFDYDSVINVPEESIFDAGDNE